MRIKKNKLFLMLVGGFLALLPTCVYSQDSGPSVALAANGFITESYNLRVFHSASLTSASASYQITQPMSRFTLKTSGIASFAFSTTATPTSSTVWETLPASSEISQNYEAASGSYLFVGATSTPVQFYFYSLGRQR